MPVEEPGERRAQRELALKVLECWKCALVQNAQEPRVWRLDSENAKLGDGAKRLLYQLIKAGQQSDMTAMGKLAKDNQRKDETHAGSVSKKNARLPVLRRVCDSKEPWLVQK